MQKEKKEQNDKELYMPLHASTKERSANTESTLTGRSGSRKPAITARIAIVKLFGSAKFI